MRCSSCGGYRLNPDEDIRRLERDANLGDVNAEAKLIISKVRAGIIPVNHVAIAAYLGDLAALATGIKPWDDTVVVSGALEWSKVLKVLKFSDLTLEILVNSSIDFAEHVLPIFENAYPNDNRPRLAIQAATKESTKESRASKRKGQVDADDAAEETFFDAQHDWANNALINSNAESASDAASAAANAAEASYWATPEAKNSKLRRARVANASSITAADSIDACPTQERAAEAEWQTKRLCDYLLDRRQLIIPPIL